LNRGVVLESLGRYEEAASDYEAVLSAQPNDPAACNNLGNVQVCFTAFTNV
jgi:Flp pilus assembly protein TadD